MARSELLEEIREAYLAANPDVAVGPVDDFCAFFTAWLAKTGVLGVGHTPNGLSLRLGDGAERLLFDQEPVQLSADTPAIQLASSGVSARQGIGGDAQAVQITGRRAH